MIHIKKPQKLRDYTQESKRAKRDKVANKTIIMLLLSEKQEPGVQADLKVNKFVYKVKC